MSNVKLRIFSTFLHVKTLFFICIVITIICFAVYGDDIDLKSRFKRRDISRTVARFVPQRLKLSANSEGSQVTGYLRRKIKNSKWKRCWFVLKDRVLYTYRASEDSVAIDTLPVLGWTVSILEQVTFLISFTLLRKMFSKVFTEFTGCLKNTIDLTYSMNIFIIWDTSQDLG